MRRAAQDEEDDLLLQRGNVQAGQSPSDGPPLKYTVTYSKKQESRCANWNKLWLNIDCAFVESSYNICTVIYMKILIKTKTELSLQLFSDVVWHITCRLNYVLYLIVMNKYEAGKPKTSQLNSASCCHGGTWPLSLLLVVILKKYYITVTCTFICIITFFM